MAVHTRPASEKISFWAAFVHLGHHCTTFTHRVNDHQLASQFGQGAPNMCSLFSNTSNYFQLPCFCFFGRCCCTCCCCDAASVGTITVVNHCPAVEDDVQFFFAARLLQPSSWRLIKGMIAQVRAYRAVHSASVCWCNPVHSWRQNFFSMQPLLSCCNNSFRSCLVASVIIGGVWRHHGSQQQQQHQAVGHSGRLAPSNALGGHVSVVCDKCEG